MKDSKSYACANGGTMRHGQLIGGHNNLARAGAPKKLTVPKLATGMKRVTTGDISPYHHGVAVMDEPMTTKISQGRQVGVHPEMQSREQRGANGYGFDVLKKSSDMNCMVGCDDQCRSIPSEMRGPGGK